MDFVAIAKGGNDGLYDLVLHCLHEGYSSYASVCSSLRLLLHLRRWYVPLSPNISSILIVPATFATQFFYGLLLSDLAQHTPANEWIAARSWVRNIVPWFLLFTGLIIASYPAGGEELTTWSKMMWDIKEYITPEDPGEIPRYFSAIGFELVALALHLSPIMKDFLASKYLLWLGKNSFAVYLIHGTLLRVVLTMFFYGPIPPPYDQEFDEAGEPLPGPEMHLLPWQFRIVMLPLWYCIVYYCAHLWTKYVDSYCAKITKKFEDYVFEESEKLPVPSTTHSASAPIPAPAN